MADDDNLMYFLRRVVKTEVDPKVAAAEAEFEKEQQDCLFDAFAAFHTTDSKDPRVVNRLYHRRQNYLRHAPRVEHEFELVAFHENGLLFDDTNGFGEKEFEYKRLFRDNNGVYSTRGGRRYISERYVHGGYVLRAVYEDGKRGYGEEFYEESRLIPTAEGEFLLEKLLKVNDLFYHKMSEEEDEKVKTAKNFLLDSDEEECDDELNILDKY